MAPALTIAEALEPIRAEPGRAAVLLDVDGTLAPIVRHADDAHVPDTTRAPLIEIAKRYAVVGCISGRRAATARRIVGLGSISYVGNHGGELLRAGAVEPELAPELVEWTARVRKFAESAWTDELRRARVRDEDKGPVVAFHWRGAPDERAAEQAVRVVAEAAEREGLGTHWGRKVLEVRSPVALDKGHGVRVLLADAGLDAAVYIGDDRTDLDAYRGLRELVEEGLLGRALCIGVHSDEAPAELEQDADLLVDGHAGVLEVLQLLASW